MIIWTVPPSNWLMTIFETLLCKAYSRGLTKYNRVNHDDPSHMIYDVLQFLFFFAAHTYKCSRKVQGNARKLLRLQNIWLATLLLQRHGFGLQFRGNPNSLYNSLSSVLPPKRRHFKGTPIFKQTTFSWIDLGGSTWHGFLLHAHVLGGTSHHVANTIRCRLQTTYIHWDAHPCVPVLSWVAIHSLNMAHLSLNCRVQQLCFPFATWIHLVLVLFCWQKLPITHPLTKKSHAAPGHRSLPAAGGQLATLKGWESQPHTEHVGSPGWIVLPDWVKN